MDGVNANLVSAAINGRQVRGIQLLPDSTQMTFDDGGWVSMVRTTLVPENQAGSPLGFYPAWQVVVGGTLPPDLISEIEDDGRDWTDFDGGGDTTVTFTYYDGPGEVDSNVAVTTPTDR